MASNIVSETIDAEYPVAGVDNDTQGFRDNFSIIKDGLATAQSEISALQSRVLLKTALPDTTLDNDLNGTSITDANFIQSTETYYGGSTVTTGQDISFLNGHYQSFTVNLNESTPSINFALANWPDRDGLAKMTVQLTGNDTAKSVTFSVDGGGTIKYNSSYPRVDGTATLTVDSSTDPIIVNFWSYNQGQTVYADYRGRFEA